MNNQIFTEQFINKVKDYLVKVCKVKKPAEVDILESCQSLYYIGKARVRFIIQKYNKDVSF